MSDARSNARTPRSLVDANQNERVFQFSQAESSSKSPDLAASDQRARENTERKNSRLKKARRLSDLQMIDSSENQSLVEESNVGVTAKNSRNTIPKFQTSEKSRLLGATTLQRLSGTPQAADNTVNLSINQNYPTDMDEPFSKKTI